MKNSTRNFFAMNTYVSYALYIKWVWLMTKVGLLDYVLYNNIQLVGVAPCKPAKNNGHGFVFTGDPWLSDPCTLVYLKQELTVLLEYFAYRCMFY